MKLRTCAPLAAAVSIALCSSCSTAMKTTGEPPPAAFLPHPLDDGWTRWLVGEWEGAGASDTGTGTGTERIELALGGQFLISHGEARITRITPEQAEYLRKNMHASREEIERFNRAGYQSLQLFTIDQRTGDVIGYLFDSLRCIATGRGRREGNIETMDWHWSNGRTSTRVTERLSDDRMRVIQRTPMPDGSVMEEMGESIRREPRLSPNAEIFHKEPEIVRRPKLFVMGTLTHIARGTESGETFAAIWSQFEAHRAKIQPHSTNKKYYGISFAAGDDGSFDYLAGMAVAPVQPDFAELVIRELPAATFAVFSCPASAIGPMKRHIFGQWHATSGHEFDRSIPMFEEYPAAEESESPVLIHIPIRDLPFHAPKGR